MNTRQHSYQGHPIIRKVEILGQDVSQYVDGISGIESSLDYPRLSEFRISEATISLRDPDNDFNTFNSNNFFVRNGQGEQPSITQKGSRSPVTIKLGFDVNRSEEVDTVFVGQILRIFKDVKSGNSRIVCSDKSQDMRNEQTTQFGLPKQMLVEQGTSPLHSNFPVFSGFSELSPDSAFGEGLIRNDTLNIDGVLNPNYYRQQPGGIQTEGASQSDELDLHFKVPYRNQPLEFLVRELLDRYEITDTDIEVPMTESSRHYFSSLGRPGYQTTHEIKNYKDEWDSETSYNAGDHTTGSNGALYRANSAQTGGTDPGAGGSGWTKVTSDEVFQWNGITTDLLADAPNDTLYILVSQTGHRIEIIRNMPEPIKKPQILKWNLRTGSKEILIDNIGDGDQNQLHESWKMVADSNFNTFYILSCKPTYVRSGGGQIRSGFQFGSYDSAEQTSTINSSVRIYKIRNAQSSPAQSTFIDHNNPLRPQLAMHYHLGFATTESDSPNRLPNRQGSLPDSRRNLYLSSSGNHLYYPFATRTKFGVARAATGGATQTSSTEIISANRDPDGFATSGFSFDIDESAGHVIFGFYQIGQNNLDASRLRVVRGDI